MDIDTAESAHALVEACSMEVGTRDMPALTAAAPDLTAGSTLTIPYLPGDDDIARLAALRAVRRLGFKPMPHLSVRRLGSAAAFRAFIEAAVGEAGIDRCLVIAGDPAIPKGPYADSASLINTGAFEQAGLRIIAVAGHPEGHPVMSADQCWQVLEHKCDAIIRRGMTPWIMTQFSFDADIVLNWLLALRGRGLDCPVRIGVPGPAGIAVLARYAALCGVGASASILSKYGISIGRLFGTAGPDRFVDRLASGLTTAHGQVSLHFFPFGGIAQSLAWMQQYQRQARRSA